MSHPDATTGVSEVRLDGVRPPTTSSMGILYDRPLRSTRTGPLYGAFPYPTKISPEAIALFIATHTNPGDTVFDGFAGSGTTGVAALLCENPPAHLREEARRLGLKVKWGARNAVLYELGALGSFVARTLTNPPEPEAFRKAASEILSETEQAYRWMYDAKDAENNEGTIRYTIWSDLVKCPVCNEEVSLWDASVGLRPAHIGPDFTCPNCAHLTPVGEVERLTSVRRDDIVGLDRELRTRCPVRVYGITGRKTWSRVATDDDLALLSRIELQPIPDSVPRVVVPWGDLYRRGYHTGITYMHHFYTRRNLIAFGHLWERTLNYDPALREALRFWLLSYNASHTTMMTRVVAKSGQDDLVVTSAQPGVLYISGLPVEKNVFDGLRRKLATVGKAFDIVHGRRGVVQVYQQSSCHVELPDASIDYVFTDPPFGGNIPYAEVNFINEAWLGKYTDRTDEVIVSNHQNKTVVEYEELLARALAEVQRILKPDAKATLIFHSASAEVWGALQSAYTSAGFGVVHASVLNKTQESFKQVTTAGAVKGDPVLLLAKQSPVETETNGSAWAIASRLQIAAAQNLDPDERTVQRLYSRLVAYFLANNQEVPVDADVFYRWCEENDALKASADAGHRGT